MSANQLSPLDQIRQTEADITRKIASARESAEQVLAKAHMDASVLKKNALDEGHREGQARYRDIILKGEEEAKALIVQAHSVAENMHRKGEATMDLAVQGAVELIIGPEGEA